MYLTRIAGIETSAAADYKALAEMYLTRIAGIETTFRLLADADCPADVSYPHSGN